MTKKVLLKGKSDVTEYFKSIIQKRYPNLVFLSDGDEIPDIVVFSIYNREVFDEKYKNCVKVLVSGENILSFNFNIIFVLWKLLNVFKINTKILNPILKYKILYKNIYDPFKKHKNYLNNLKKNEFAIIPLEINNKNTYNTGLYYYHDKFKDLLKEKKTKKKFCAFIVSNPNNYERNLFYTKLSKYRKIDSFGKVYNNMDSKIKREEVRDNYKIFKDYKFVICFENSYEKGYITEKILNVMLAGSIPIYKGASDINKYFNTKSFINYDDYGSFDKMIQRVIEIDKNEDEYQKILKEPYFKNNKIPKILENKKEEFDLILDKIFK